MGNPSRRPFNSAEPRPKLGRPKRPKFLRGLARKEWNSIVPELESLGIICKIEGAALAGYCQCYKRWTEAEEEIDRRGILIVVEEKDKDGNFHIVGSVKNPAVNVADAMMKQMRAFLVEFGLTPASRSRIAVLPTRGAEVSRAASYFIVEEDAEASIT